MAGLVEEIQAKVLDDSVSTTELLRLVKLAATKLKLDDTAGWVDNELKGYPGTVAVPDYRKTKGQLKSHHPHWGVRAVGGDPATLDTLSTQEIREPISQVETLAGDGTHEVAGRLPEWMIAKINEWNGGPRQDYHVHIGCAVFQNVSHQVRNLILDWAITLESKGILGEGISFSVEEKQKAAAAGPSVSIGTLNGSFHQGDVTGNQNRTMVDSTDNSSNTTTSENVFDLLVNAVDSNVGNQSDRETLLAIIEQMKQAKGTTDYKPLFQKLVGYTADYVTVLTPFLPALATFVPG